MFNFKINNDNAPESPSLLDVKGLLHDKVIEELEENFTNFNELDLAIAVRAISQEIEFFDGLDLSDLQISQIISAVADDLSGYGPIAPYMIDENISDILINDFNDIWVDKQGRLVKTPSSFDNSKHLLRFIERALNHCGKQTNTLSPVVDGKLPDGSRLNVIIPPACTTTAIVSIRKFSHKTITKSYLIQSGLIDSNWLEFLECAVEAGANIVVSGNAGAGKTSFLNVLSSAISENERVVTIEESSELKLHHNHVVQLEAHSANSDDKGSISLSELVKAALRMRADRVIIGEVRSSEVIDMLQAMSCGHQGSMTTVHANSAYDAISRISTLTQLHNQQFSSDHIDALIGSCLQLIIHLIRDSDGKRKLKSIGEVYYEEGTLKFRTLYSDTDRFIFDKSESAIIKFMRMRGIEESRLEALFQNIEGSDDD